MERNADGRIERGKRSEGESGRKEKDRKADGRDERRRIAGGEEKRKPDNRKEKGTQIEVGTGKEKGKKTE